MKVHAIAAFFLLLPIIAGCEGVLVCKEHEFHSDDSANSWKFDVVNPQGFVTWFSANGKAMRFESTQWFRYVEFPLPLLEAVDPKVLQTRLKELKSLEDFSARFKKASPLLQQAIAQVRSDTENLKNDLVFHDKVWTPRVDYEASQRKKFDDIEQQARKEKQRKQQEIEKIMLENELQTKKSEERRAIKIQELRDKLGNLGVEKSNIQLQNNILREELLSIINRGKINSEK